MLQILDTLMTSTEDSKTFKGPQKISEDAYLLIFIPSDDYLLSVSSLNSLNECLSAKEIHDKNLFP